MSCAKPPRLVLSPTLLGRDGVRRAFTLVSPDRPDLTLDAWLIETGATLPSRDRLLLCGCGEALPDHGMVGLIAPTGCLFAVFAYAVERGAQADDTLAIRGPSWSAPMGGRMVPEGIDTTIAHLAADLHCAAIRRAPW